MNFKKVIIIFYVVFLLIILSIPFALASDYDISTLDFNTLKAKSHPYMFFTSTDIAALQARWSNPSSLTPLYYIKQGILTNANSAIGTQFENGDFGEIGQNKAQNYAFAYLMDNSGQNPNCAPYSDCSYLNLAKQALLAMDKNDAYFDGHTNAGNLDTTKGMIGYCLAYDMIKPTLSASDKAQIEYKLAQEMVRTYTFFNYTVPEKDWGDGINIVTQRAQSLAMIAFCSMAIPDYTNSLVAGCRIKDGQQNYPICNGPIMDDINPNNAYDFQFANYNSDYFFNWAMNGLFGDSRESIGSKGDKYWYYTFSRDGISQSGVGYEQWPLSTGLPLFMALGKNFPLNNPFENPTIYSMYNKYAYTSDNIVYQDNAAYVGGQIPYNKAARMGLPTQVLPFAPLLTGTTLKNDMLYWLKKKFDTPGGQASGWTDYHSIAGFVNIGEITSTEWSTISTPTTLDFYAPEGGAAVMKSGYNKNDSFVWIDGDNQMMNSNQEQQHQGEFIFESRGELLLFTHGRVNTQDFDVPEYWKTPFPDPGFYGGPNLGWSWLSSSAQHNVYLIYGYGQKMSVFTTPYSAFEERPDPAYLRQMLTADNFGFVESDMYYGAVSEIGDNITISRNFLFPNRDYLIVIDRIDGNKQHNYTNQLHVGEPKATIAEVGTLSVSDNEFTLQTPRNLNLYGYFITPDNLNMQYIDTNKSIYYGGGDSNYHHYHLRSSSVATDTDFINVLIPRFATEPQPTVTILPATGGKAGQIKIGKGAGASTEIVTLKEADEVSTNKVATDAEISFMRDAKPFEYFFIKNGSYFVYNGIAYFNSTANLIATLKYSNTNITGKINQLSGDNVNSADIQIYTEKSPVKAYLNNSLIPFAFDENTNRTSISLNGFGELKLLLEIPLCIIQNAKWSRGSAIAGETVDITIKGKDCDNVKVNLTYKEVDNASDSDPNNESIDADLLNLPKNVTINGNTGTYTWTAKWVEDSDSVDKDPEIAVTAIANNTVTSGTLKVSEFNYKLMNISLAQGWNLINIPLAAVNQTIEHVFREIKDKIDVIAAFDPINRWLVYHFDTSIPSRTFNITPDRAYKIKAKENTTLIINGTDSTLPRTLEAGWNLMGLKQTDEVSFKDFFALYADKIEIGWKLVNGTYEQINVASNDKMQPVKGYWLLINETIEISG